MDTEILYKIKIIYILKTWNNNLRGETIYLNPNGKNLCKNIKELDWKKEIASLLIN